MDKKDRFFLVIVTGLILYFLFSIQQTLFEINDGVDFLTQHIEIMNDKFSDLLEKVY